MRWGLVPWWWKKTLKEVLASFNNGPAAHGFVLSAFYQPR
jgi:putative SOS response-associated peptidase YedK